MAAKLALEDRAPIRTGNQLGVAGEVTACDFGLKFRQFGDPVLDVFGAELNGERFIGNIDFDDIPFAQSCDGAAGGGFR